METEDIRQIVVIRRDLKMRRGKEIAQGAHAAMAWLTDRIRRQNVMSREIPGGFTEWVRFDLSGIEHAWIHGAFTKVVVQVEDEEALRAVYERAVSAKVVAYLITDAGRTEFGGVPTVTACGIGPDLKSRLDPITGHLQLY